MRSIILISAALLASCATVDKRKVIRQSDPELHQSLNANFAVSASDTACDTPIMRTRILDDDPTNDTALITVTRDASSGSPVLTDITVDCHEYFARRLQRDDIALASTPNYSTLSHHTQVPKMISGPVSSQAEPIQPASRIISAHKVSHGESLTQIARKHCLSVDNILASNPTYQSKNIQIGDVIILPLESC